MADLMTPASPWPDADRPGVPPLSEAELARIESRLWPSNDALYIGSCGTMRRLIAMARANAAALAAARREGAEEMREAAAALCNQRGIEEQEGFGLGRSAQNYYRARDAIRALAPSPDAQEKKA